MASLLVERSVIDLKSQVTVNGACSISSSDVKCLVCDSARAKVWAVASLSFSLWYQVIYIFSDSLHYDIIDWFLLFDSELYYFQFS